MILPFKAERITPPLLQPNNKDNERSNHPTIQFSFNQLKESYQVFEGRAFSETETLEAGLGCPADTIRF